MGLEWIVVNHMATDPLSGPSNLPFELHLLEQPNRGFASGMNLAARHARAPILLCLNPDVLISGPAIEQAVDYLHNHPDVAILGPRVLYPDGSRQQTARRFYTWPAVLWARLPLRDRLPTPRFWRRYLMLDAALDKPSPVDWLMGCVLFLRPGLLEPLPAGAIFDDRFFLYFEDVDLCLRAWQHGGKVVYHPGPVCIHEHQRASHRLLSPAARHHAVSLLRFVRKHRGLGRRPV